MPDLKSLRPIDLAIGAVLVIVLALGVYLGVSMWQYNQSVKQAAPITRSINDLIKQVRKDPNSLSKRMNLAQALVVAGREREAIEQYEEILKVKKDYPPALSGLGFIALKRQDWELGERYYRKIIDLREGQVDSEKDVALETAYFYLGSALMEQGDYEEAAQSLTKSLRIRRDASDTHYLLAVCFRELGNERKYRSSLENALMFDPTLAEANYDYGMMLLDGGDTAGAAEYLRHSVDAAPDAEKPAEALAEFGDADERYAKAKQLATTGDLKEALIQARIAVALEPTSAEKLLFLASLYEKDKNKEEAATAYRRILLFDPTNKEALTGLERVS